MSRVLALTASALLAGLTFAGAERATAGPAPAAAGLAPRAGLWKLVAGDLYDAADPITLCYSGKRIAMGPTGKACASGFTYRRTATGVAVDESCSVRGVTQTIHGVATGDFQSSYATDVEVKMSMRPGAPQQVIRSHSVYRYVGPCAPGQVPDDR